MTSMWRPTVAIPATLSLVGIAGVALGCAESREAESRSVGGELNSAQGEPTTGSAPGMLLTSNRSMLSICVDALGDSDVSEGELDHVSTVLAVLRRELVQRGYQPVVLDLLADAAVVAGCPPAVALDEGTHYFDPKRSQPGVIGRGTRKPSEYRLHIYIVGVDLFQEWFGNAPYVTSTEELMCTGHQCWGVTSGLYLTASNETAILYEAVRGLLGFNDPFESLPPIPTPRSYTAVDDGA